MAAQADIAGPPGSIAFGKTVAALPNGNIIVIDPNGPVSNVGAVYLYTPDRALISTLTGSSTDDHVGSGGVTVLANGNFVVASPNWNNGTNLFAGAVTWVNGSTGLAGVVSASNSLIGTWQADHVGSSGITPLSNGNYMVRSLDWHGASAVTWGNGSSGTSGELSSANSLVGSASHDYLGTSIVELSNGNVVVASVHWKGETGAATWVNGTTGTAGSISAANSLIGPHLNSGVGAAILALTNGNYVVLSPGWSVTSQNGSIGAATWASGSTGLTGIVSIANSLTGSSANDLVGSSGIALANGNYVIGSAHWHNGATVDAGAATWANGNTGLAGVAVSASNSLVGTTTGVGVGGNLVALANGNYVVASPHWDNGATVDAGAVTWGNGGGGIAGPVSAANSLIGTTTNDLVGSAGVTALANGNYVVASPNWDNGVIVNAGAATWGNGATGLIAAVSAANSLVGATTGDSVGNGGIVALHGNGHYVVSSPLWDNGAVADAGAATWANGSSGAAGTISAANSLIGTTSGDGVGVSGVIALSNGNYVVSSILWDNGASVDVGAVTWANGSHGRVGAVSPANSLIGKIASDSVGGDCTALSDGSFAVRSPYWDNGRVSDAGAVTLANGRFLLKGLVQAWNSVFGKVASQGITLTHAYDAPRQRLIVGKPAENTVSVFTMDQMFADGFE